MLTRWLVFFAAAEKASATKKTKPAKPTVKLKQHTDDKKTSYLLEMLLKLHKRRKMRCIIKNTNMQAWLLNLIPKELDYGSDFAS